jgi:hypothetical protein
VGVGVEKLRNLVFVLGHHVCPSSDDILQWDYKCALAFQHPRGQTLQDVTADDDVSDLL